MVSATTYTLVGVVNKFITVLLNVLIWDKHSSPIGLIGNSLLIYICNFHVLSHLLLIYICKLHWNFLAVCLCLAAGAGYQQAPKRETVSNKDKDSEPLIVMKGQNKI